jgi:hypothetical protein
VSKWNNQTPGWGVGLLDQKCICSSAWNIATQGHIFKRAMPVIKIVPDTNPNCSFQYSALADGFDEVIINGLTSVTLQRSLKSPFVAMRFYQVSRIMVNTNYGMM